MNFSAKQDSIGEAEQAGTKTALDSDRHIEAAVIVTSEGVLAGLGFHSLRSWLLVAASADPGISRIGSTSWTYSTISGASILSGLGLSCVVWWEEAYVVGANAAGDPCVL